MSAEDGEFGDPIAVACPLAAHNTHTTNFCF